MSELKPCPFCGGEAFYIKIMGNYDKPHEIYCSKCDGAITEGRSEKQVVTNWNTRPIEDALNARIAECESALISMVQQFFYSKADENIFRHAFMSAEEEAADYLVEHGIARWADKRKSSIYFNEVQE